MKTNNDPQAQLMSDEQLEKLEQQFSHTTHGDWYTVEQPWLPKDCPTYIIAGSPDPHVGDRVCYMQDFDANDYEDEREGEAQGWADAEFICAVKNNFLALAAQAKSTNHLQTQLDEANASIGVLVERIDWAEEAFKSLENWFRELADSLKQEGFGEFFLAITGRIKEAKRAAKYMQINLPEATRTHLERQRKMEEIVQSAQSLYKRWRRRSDETIRLTLHPDHPNEIILPDTNTQQYLDSLKTDEWQAMETLFERVKALSTTPEQDGGVEL